MDSVDKLLNANESHIEDAPMSVQSQSSRLTIEESIDASDPAMMVYTIVDEDPEPEANRRLKYGRYSLPETELYREHELQDKTLSRSFDNTNSTTTSAVRITITDMDGYDSTSFNMTTTALKKCKQLVLLPYLRLLIFISWRPFGKESYHSTRWRCLNIFYPTCVVLLLFYTYVYELVSCQWKLNIAEDTKEIPVVPIPLITAQTIFPEVNVTTDAVTSYNVMDDTELTNLTIGATNISPHTIDPVCEHVVTTYVIPNMLHFIAFVMGFFYFRIQENEQLYALMEKVFLQGSGTLQVSPQTKMIRKLRFFLAFGALWVVMTMGLQGLFLLAFGIDRTTELSKLGDVMKWVLFVIEMVGIMLLNAINLAVIINHATQCELLVYYVQGLSTKLQEKSLELKAAMKDILMVRHSIGSLNGPMSKMTSLAVVRFAELVFMGLCILILNEKDNIKIWSYRSIFPLVWLVMMIFPLVQAARINSVCSKFKQIALETRVFGYRNSSQLDLDSFLLFVSQTRLRAKLFHIPVKPSYLIGIVVLAAFILLLLLQTTYIGSASHYL